jgi:catechol 2,3-dioxygenase-like lactoylglutathione lyase family enzyme
MSARIGSASLLALGLIVNPVLLSPVYASPPARLSIANTVPFFYYTNLDEAVDWYENKLGFKKVTQEDFVVIFEITKTSQLGLVNATGGTLQPTDKKGVLLSIETAELESWYERLNAVEGINITQGIVKNDNGLIEEFRLVDPGGYIIEFFRWRSHRAEAKKYTH